jgi:pimeloyl-ACP methyl ester carboxylesterase
VSWLNRPDVHGGEVCAGVVSGLVAPTAPDDHRWETLWHYMQGGPGVFKGDLYFYKVDGDIRDKVGEIDVKRCPLYLLTGEYDYSCTSEATLDIAKRTGAEATIMRGLGHFPMSEDPPKFISYLLPVLEKISAKE